MSEQPGYKGSTEPCRCPKPTPEPLTAEEEAQVRSLYADDSYHDWSAEWVGRLLATIDVARGGPGLDVEVLIAAQHSINVEVGGCDHEGGTGDCADRVADLLARAALDPTAAGDTDV